MMLPKRLNWYGLLLLPLLALKSLPLFAISLEDAGPMPQPKGPYFSSKPLLYFGEEPSVGGTRPLDREGENLTPAPRVGGYPNTYAPAPFSFGPNRVPSQQMAPPPQGWGIQRPYYPAYPGQLNYPVYRGYPAIPPYQGRGGR